MIISRTPLRMSFLGGGSDLPAFYQNHVGAVISTAIQKYVYITVNPKFEESIRLSYSKTEEVENAQKIEHPLVRETLRYLELSGGLEITSIADIPSKGTGLGSSSSFTVGLLNALGAFKKELRSAKQLAEAACEIEIDRCHSPIGKQDQYAAAFGGFRFYRFQRDGSVFTDPIICKKETLQELEQNLVCFYTGLTRDANAILKTQSDTLGSQEKSQNRMKDLVSLAEAFKQELECNRLNQIGKLLNEGWNLKKEMSVGISNSQIDQWVDVALKEGAEGGKLLGAGAGGFLMFYAPKERHEKIKTSLKLREVSMKFEPEGSKIIFVHE